MITVFSHYLQYNRGLSVKTVETYSDNLHAFARYAQGHLEHKRWSTITKSDIDKYVTFLVDAGMKPASIKQHVSTLRTYYKTLMAMGAKIDNPARYVSTPKLADPAPKIIPKEDVKKALESNLNTSISKAIIAIIFETGIRLQELLDLKADDIDPANHAIKIHGKGNKERTVYYGPLTERYFGVWEYGKYTQRDVRHIVFEALKPCSNAPQLSPHALRHTYASELINNGMSMEAISKLLGHTHLQTTEIYAKLSNEKARSLYQEFAPTLN